MKGPSIKIFFFFISFFVLVGLACGLSTQPDSVDTSPPEMLVEEEPVTVIQEPEVVEEVVEPPAPTDPPMRQIPPTQTPEPVEEITEELYEEPEEESPQTAGLEFFVEEFDQDPGWYFEVMQGGEGDPNSVSYNFDFSRMIFDIPERDLYAYYIYDGVTYDNVRLDINYENRGVNSQQVSLICQMSDEGWYEFAVQSDGLWRLYAFTDQFYQIASGGSKYIKTGKEVNEYTLICEGNTLSFFINGVEPTGSPHVDRKYALRWGEVGFSVSSLRATPVKVEVDWFAITLP